MNEIGLNDCAWQDGYFLSLVLLEKLAYLYIDDQLSHGREWVSIEKMAHAIGLSEREIVKIMKKFRLDKSLPFVYILEEMRG